MKFTLAARDFDAELLPSRPKAGSSTFRREVQAYFKEQYERLGGKVDVRVADDEITVSWEPSGASRDPLDEALELLNAGRLQEAVPLLQGLAASVDAHPTVHYNLGMALSDLGRLDLAIKHLMDTLKRSPQERNVLTALGVAYQRKGETATAREWLEKAVALDPSDGFANRNLGAVTATLGDYKTAAQHLRRAVVALPGDQASLFGLADLLLRIDDDGNSAEADDLLVRAIDANEYSDIAELARQRRSAIAQATMRDRSGGFRPDAMMYCLGALQKFSAMTPEEIDGVFYEVAMLGMRGLDVNDPAQKYTLRSMPGNYSGLHLVSIMYTANEQLHPAMDVGFDLRAEYEAALAMQGGSPSQPSSS